MQILPIGNLLKIDSDGYLVNNSSVDEIGSPWKEAVAAMKRKCIEGLGDNLHSIYLRGSVSQGKAIENISDIDFIVLINDEKLLNDSFLDDARRDLSKAYPFSNAFDFIFAEVHSIRDTETYFEIIFLIKTSSVCIYGKDISKEISRFKPSKEVAGHFHRNLLNVYKRAKEGIEKDSTQQNEWCTWVMKRIVRAGFTLVMHKEKVFTRDLYPCYEIFAKYYPEKRDRMYKALKMAINPPTEKIDVFSTIDGLGVWLANEIESEFSVK